MGDRVKAIGLSRRVGVGLSLAAALILGSSCANRQATPVQPPTAAYTSAAYVQGQSAALPNAVSAPAYQDVQIVQQQQLAIPDVPQSIGQESLSTGERVTVVTYVHHYPEAVDSFPSVYWSGRWFYNVHGNFVFWDPYWSRWAYYWGPPSPLVMAWNFQYPWVAFAWGQGFYGPGWYWGGVTVSGFHHLAQAPDPRVPAAPLPAVQSAPRPNIPPATSTPLRPGPTHRVAPRPNRPAIAQGSVPRGNTMAKGTVPRPNRASARPNRPPALSQGGVPRPNGASARPNGSARRYSTARPNGANLNARRQAGYQIAGVPRSSARRNSAARPNSRGTIPRPSQVAAAHRRSIGTYVQGQHMRSGGSRGYAPTRRVRVYRPSQSRSAWPSSARSNWGNSRPNHSAGYPGRVSRPAPSHARPNISAPRPTSSPRPNRAAPTTRSVSSQRTVGPSRRNR